MRGPSRDEQREHKPVQRICNSCGSADKKVVLFRCVHRGNLACKNCATLYRGLPPVESWILLCPFCDRNYLETVEEAVEGLDIHGSEIWRTSQLSALAGEGGVVCGAP